MALSKILENSITDGVVSSAKLKDFSAAVDLNGVELILDADQDTSITADTDDRIDFKIANVEHFSFSNSSGDTVVKPMVDAKDIIFQQYDGNKILEINDGNYVAISGAAAGPGELRFYEDTDLGSHYTGFKAGNATASLSYVLPLADGTDGYQLTTDGSGTLTWAAGGATLTGSTNNTITTVTAANAFQGEANLTFDGSTLAVTGAATVSTTLGVTGILTGSNTVIGTTFEPTGDTSASDNAAVGYTAAEGLILTGQGSTNDVTIKNDADADVIEIPTGTTNVTVAGNLGVGGTAVANTDTDTSNTGNVTLDFAANQNFVLTLTGNTTLVNPSTETVGQSGFIALIQDGTGGRTLTLGTDYETAAGAGITLTTTASATDLIPYVVVAANRILLGKPQLAFS